MLKYFYILIFIFTAFFAYPAKPLSDGYKDIKLGMNQAQVKSLLEKSVDFNLKKEEILSMRLEPDTEIISTEGLGFIISGYFHFSHDQLFQILLNLSETKIGYYYILNKFINSFGKPNNLNPEKATWENDKVRISLEKPCTLKYIYLPVWNGLVKEKENNDNFEKDREKFVDGL